MQTEKTASDSIRALSSFLMEQMAPRPLESDPDGVILWREYLPDHFSDAPQGYFAGSIWTAADVIYSLVQTLGCEQFVSGQHFKDIANCIGPETFALQATRSFRAIHNDIHDRATLEFNNLVVPLSGMRTNVALLARILRVLVKDLHSYIGMPRSFIVDEFGHVERGTANLAVMTVVCRTLTELYKTVPDDEKAFIRSFLREAAAYVSQPSLSVLRIALRSASQQWTKQKGRKDDVAGFIGLVSAKYAEVRDAAIGGGGIEIDEFDPGSDLDELAKLITTHFSLNDLTKSQIGCLWPANGSFGWSYSAQNLVSSVDPAASLSAIEIIVHALAHTSEPQLRKRFHMLIRHGADQFADFLAKRSDDQKFESLKTDDKLSDKWSIEFLCRHSVNLVHLLRTIDNLQSEVDHLSEARDRIAACLECLYSALIVKSFESIVERRTIPFEAIPQEFVSGNELGHAPGIDIGYVTYALLLGSQHFNPSKAKISYVQFRGRFSAIVGVGSNELATRLPPDLRLFTVMIDHLSRRIVHEQDEPYVASAMGYGFNSVNEKDHANRPRLSGAFLSSYSEPKEGDYFPKVYIWATAHALLALVEWVRVRFSSSQLEEQISEQRHLIDDLTNEALQQRALSSALLKFSFPATSGKTWRRLLLLAAIVAVTALSLWMAGEIMLFPDRYRGSLQSRLLLRNSWEWSDILALDRMLAWLTGTALGFGITASAWSYFMLRGTLAVFDSTIAQTGLCGGPGRCAIGGATRCIYKDDKDDTTCRFAMLQDQAPVRGSILLSYWRMVFALLLGCGALLVLSVYGPTRDWIVWAVAGLIGAGVIAIRFPLLFAALVFADKRLFKWLGANSSGVHKPFLAIGQIVMGKAKFSKFEPATDASRREKQ